MHLVSLSAKRRQSHINKEHWMNDSHYTARKTLESGGSQNPNAPLALTILRISLGALFISVFFENLRKGLYSPAGYSGLINYYIEKGHGPQTLKAVMGLMASHASVAGPMQGFTEITFGFLLVLGILTRPVALAAFLFLTTLWIAELGTAWIWELLIPMLVALSLMIGSAGRKWGIDGLIARKYPRVPLW
jgi:uncharacterized membrane protein YphA (DoxX/SURF4 family)